MSKNAQLETGLAQNIANPSSLLDSKNTESDVDQILPCKLSPDSGQLQIKFSSSINKKDKEQLALLITHINEKKLFKIKRLHIKECASLTGISKREISRLVNNYLRLSFSDFVNLFRIEDFKEKIANGEATKYSLLHMALESGFSSKSTFYYTFKKLTNTSPVQILNQANKA